MEGQTRPTESRKARIIACGNQKGGVTKTSTVVNLSAALAERGKKVLVWDLDVNCGSTRHFGIPEGMNLYGTFEVLTGEEEPKDVIVTSDDTDVANLPPNVHLIASHTKLEALDAALTTKLGPFVTPFDLLQEPVSQLLDQYDYIFFDTAPSLTTATRCAYKAAKFFILVSIPESFSIDGLTNAVKYIQQARQSGNPGLTLMGVVMNSVPGRKTRLASELIAYVDKVFGPEGGGDEFMARYETLINASTLMPSVQKQRKTVFQVDPEHKVTQQFRALAVEVEERFARLDAKRSGSGKVVAMPREQVARTEGTSAPLSEVVGG